MDSLVVATTRTVLERAFPDEVQDLDAAVERFGNAGQPADRPPVGSGLDMLTMADGLLAVVAALFGAVSGAVAEQVAKQIGDRTTAMLQRRLSHPQDAPAALDDQQVSAVHAAVVTVLAAEFGEADAELAAAAVIGVLRLRDTSGRD